MDRKYYTKSRTKYYGSNEYQYIHQWLRKYHGNATKCTATDCPDDSTRYQWALIHGNEHGRDISRYQQMCHPCHFKYDRTGESNGGGWKWSEDAKKKLSDAKRGRPNLYMLGRHLSFETRIKMRVARYKTMTKQFMESGLYDRVLGSLTP